MGEGSEKERERASELPTNAMTLQIRNKRSNHGWVRLKPGTPLRYRTRMADPRTRATVCYLPRNASAGRWIRSREAVSHKGTQMWRDPSCSLSVSATTPTCVLFPLMSTYPPNRRIKLFNHSLCPSSVLTGKSSEVSAISLSLSAVADSV